MERLIPPSPPVFSDFPKEESALATEMSPFIIAHRKYTKDMIAYSLALKEQEQTKFIKDIQRSSLKLALKKYKVTKNI